MRRKNGDLAARIRELQQRVMSMPSTGLKADKAFFDELSGDLQEGESAAEGSDRPSLRVVEAAARQLWVEGAFHHWWPESASSYEGLDPIGKDEFDAIVERVLITAVKAARERDV